MRFQVVRKKKFNLAGKTSQAVDIPAPLGGVNTRDSLSIMAPTDAIELENYIPQQNGLISRKGFSTATGNKNFVFMDNANFTFVDGNNFVFMGDSGSDTYPDIVYSAIPYVSGVNSFMITASGGKLFKDNTSGVLTELGSGFANDRWEASKISNNMVLVNGADAPRNFDGTNLTITSFSGDLASYGAENINGIHKYRNRLFLYNTNYGNFFYGGVNSIAGAFTEFQLNRVSDTGGNIIAVKSLTHDAGDGIDDYIVFILDTGEVLMYAGGDPNDADDWRLVGKYKIPPLINRRCATQLAGDVILLTKQDLIKLSDVVRFTGEQGGFNNNPSKLAGGITDDFNTYGNIWGWEVSTYPRGGWIIVNVPEIEGQQSHQWVVNIITGASTKFTGWNATTFAILNDNLYFGEDKRLCIGDEGLDDDGADIKVLARQGFTNLGNSQKKKVSNLKMFLKSDGIISVDVGIAYDFGVVNPQSIQQNETSGSAWDIADWDIADWSFEKGNILIFKTAGIGVYTSIQKRFNVKGQRVNWYSTTYNYNIANAF